MIYGKLPREGEIWVIRFHRGHMAKLMESTGTQFHMLIAIMTDVTYNICILWEERRGG